MRGREVNRALALVLEVSEDRRHVALAADGVEEQPADADEGERGSEERPLTSRLPTHPATVSAAIVSRAPPQPRTWRVRLLGRRAFTMRWPCAAPRRRPPPRSASQSSSRWKTSSTVASKNRASAIARGSDGV